MGLHSRLILWIRILLTTVPPLAWRRDSSRGLQPSGYFAQPGNTPNNTPIRIDFLHQFMVQYRTHVQLFTCRYLRALESEHDQRKNDHPTKGSFPPDQYTIIVCPPTPWRPVCPSLDRRRPSILLVSGGPPQPPPCAQTVAT